MIEKKREIIFEERTHFLNLQNAMDFFVSQSPGRFHEYKLRIEQKELSQLCKCILIFSIDKFWIQYLADINEVREEIHLYSFGGYVPYYEFQKTAEKMFSDLSRQMTDDMIQMFNNMSVTEKDFDSVLEKLQSPSATWTYLINDNPMEKSLIGIVPDIGLSAATGITAPIAALFVKLRNIIKRQADPLI